MTNDRVLLAVVITLGLVALSLAVGGIILALDSKSIPDSLIAIGAAAVGYLGGLLTPFPTRGK